MVSDAISGDWCRWIARDHVCGARFIHACRGVSLARWKKLEGYLFSNFSAYESLFSAVFPQEPYGEFGDFQYKI